MNRHNPDQCHEWPDETPRAPLAAIKEIASAWSLNDAERAAVAGASEADLAIWLADAKAGHDVRLPASVFERVGYLWNLREMFSEIGSDESAADFIRTQKSHAGETPLERAMDPDVERLRDLCAEIDTIFGEGICPEPFAWEPNAVG